MYTGYKQYKVIFCNNEIVINIYKKEVPDKEDAKAYHIEFNKSGGAFNYYAATHKEALDIGRDESIVERLEAHDFELAADLFMDNYDFNLRSNKDTIDEITERGEKRLERVLEKQPRCTTEDI